MRKSVSLAKDSLPPGQFFGAMKLEDFIRDRTVYESIERREYDERCGHVTLGADVDAVLRVGDLIVIVQRARKDNRGGAN